MITVKIHAGLGNQMFQYAFGRALSLKNHDQLRVDPAMLYDVLKTRSIAPRNYALSTVFAINPQFNWTSRMQTVIKVPYLSKAFNRYYPRIFGALGVWRYLQEKKHYTFDAGTYNATGNLYLDGFWQTEKYFKAYEATIRKDFSFRAPLQGATAQLAGEIRNSNAVCLNVRRQEIFSDATLRAMYDVASPEYYDSAIQLMKEKAGAGIVVFVISDDIGWCRKNMKINAEHRFIGTEHYGAEFRDALQLMTLFKYFILPNSSFAWWGAWLAEPPDKVVIAPRRWNRTPGVDNPDLLPEAWIAL